MQVCVCCRTITNTLFASSTRFIARLHLNLEPCFNFQDKPRFGESKAAGDFWQTFLFCMVLQSIACLREEKAFLRAQNETNSTLLLSTALDRFDFDGGSFLGFRTMA
ncbi:hypothetical protein chiPu_0004251 [Chiloscyllium punctatum]|uniref:Uncharacterized protein n=1 Tax=Chiloscyllium punctatum TaxID=137246 RepID=A0A401S631_CHIPU|nr:hypothetical protein [Chiloscyllium punctatum]